jgi:hypothetical protein
MLAPVVPAAPILHVPVVAPAVTSVLSVIVWLEQIVTGDVTVAVGVAAETFTTIVAVVAQEPTAGVNVYVVGPTTVVPAEVISQVPVIGVALVDVVGNNAVALPSHKGPTFVNIGTTCGVMLMVTTSMSFTQGATPFT